MRHLRDHWRLALGGSALLAIIVASALYGEAMFAWSREQIIMLDALSDRHPVLFAASLIALYGVLATVFIPCDFILMPAAGAFFGVWGGLLVASLANALGPTGAFLLSRHALRQRTVERYSEYIAKVDRGIEQDGWLYMVILRIAPILPAPLVNVAAGVTCLPLWKYVSATVVGKVPLTILYLMVGNQIAHIQSVSDVITPQMLGALAGFAGFLLASRVVYAKYLGKNANPNAA